MFIALLLGWLGKKNHPCSRDEKSDYSTKTPNSAFLDAGRKNILKGGMMNIWRGTGGQLWQGEIHPLIGGTRILPEKIGEIPPGGEVRASVQLSGATLEAEGESVRIVRTR